VVGKRHFGDAHSAAELGAGDLAQTQLVEISEELPHTDAELLHLSAQLGQHILQVVGTVVADEGASHLGGLERGEALQVFLGNVHTLVENVDVGAELVVVDFVVVAVVHVFDQDQLELFGVGQQVELVENAGELALGDVAVLGLVEILEVRFHEHAFVLDFDSENI
jgi:hypothetical protein